MYFKTDFYFLWRDFRYRDITSIKRFSKGAKILGQSLYGHGEHFWQVRISCLPCSLKENPRGAHRWMQRSCFSYDPLRGNAPTCTEMHRNAPKCTEMHRRCKAKQSKAKQSWYFAFFGGFALQKPLSFCGSKASHFRLAKATSLEASLLFKSQLCFAPSMHVGALPKGSKEPYGSKRSRREPFGHVRGLRSARRKMGSFASFKANSSRRFLTDNLKITKITVPEMFAFKSLTYQSNPDGYERKACRKVFFDGGLKSKLASNKKPRNKRGQNQKERANNILSGEIFKERFTDILQTSLELVGFSLESHNQKPYTACWKKLQNGTNRRLPYFTPFFFSFLFSFPQKPQKRAKTKKKKRFFPWGLQISTLRHQPLQALQIQTKAKEGKRNKLKKLHAKSLALALAPKVHVHVHVHLHDFVQFGKRKTLFGNDKSLINIDKAKVHIGAFTNRPSRVTHARRFVSARMRSLFCSTKVGLSSRDIKPNKSLLTIKIGDYLSSGDQIGEKVLSKTPLLQKSKSPFLYSPKALVEGVRLRSSHVSGKGIKSDYPFSTSMLSKSSCKICSYEKNARTSSPQKISTPIILDSSGRIVTISKTQVIVQKMQPVLFYKSANLHVKKGSWIKQGSPILTLTHQTLITGDIVQGIPRIEQLFEAFTSPPPAFKDKGDFTKFKDGYNTLHSQVRDIFRKNWLKNRLPIAVRKSLEEIGYILVEMIQKVYLSQGVLIADKHIEIIVRQIASKGQILDSGSTGLFLEEVLPIQQIENANLTTPGKKCLYVPAVMGLTAAALNSDSFISAASFQETTRVLSRDAIVGKSDFLRGLKEKVVIGDLISAGTGLDLYFIYTTMLTN